MSNGPLERHPAVPDDPVAPLIPVSRRRRAGYLLCGLLAVPLLVVCGGLWLTGGGHPAPSLAAAASAAGPAAIASAAAVSARPATVPGPAQPTPGACAPAASPGCAPSPIHVSLARVPAPHAPHRLVARATLHSAAPSSASPARPAPTGPTATGPTATGPTATGPAGPSGTPGDQVLALINQARSAAGLPPLTVSAGLVASADAHDLRMAGGCGLTHQCPGEPAIGERETAAGVTWTAAGENIGEGGPVAATTAATAQMAVTLTQDMLDEQPPDDGHRLNILSVTFTHIGIAVYRDSSGIVWLTQDFSD